MVCGNFSGVSLKCYSKNKEQFLLFSEPYTVLKMDPRNFHEVVIDEPFRGVRYTLVLYIVDHRVVEPRFYPPTYLD